MDCRLLQDVITNSPVKTCIDFTQHHHKQHVMSGPGQLLFKTGCDYELLVC